MAGGDTIEIESNYSRRPFLHLIRNSNCSLEPVLVLVTPNRLTFYSVSPEDLYLKTPPRRSFWAASLLGGFVRKVHTCTNFLSFFEDFS